MSLAPVLEWFCWWEEYSNGMEKSEMVEELMCQVCGVIQKIMEQSVMNFVLAGGSSHPSSKAMDEESVGFPKFP